MQTKSFFGGVGPSILLTFFVGGGELGRVWVEFVLSGGGGVEANLEVDAIGLRSSSTNVEA